MDLANKFTVIKPIYNDTLYLRFERDKICYLRGVDLGVYLSFLLKKQFTAKVR